jgi:hypothetical protein
MTRKIDFYITGFGTFSNVSKNPTEDIITWLPKYLENNPFEVR